jgi:hypothetical protein
LGEAFLCWLRWKGWDERPESMRTCAPVERQHAEDWCSLATMVLGRLPKANAANQPSKRTYGEMLGPRAGLTSG